MQLNACLLKYAEAKGYEDGKSLRGDTTSTETNIHYPADASLLNDSVRVLTRIMNRLLSWTEVEFPSSDHHKRAKRKLFIINNSRKPRQKQDAYLELIRVAEFTLGYAKRALPILAEYKPTSEEFFEFEGLVAELNHYIPMVNTVIYQARERIIEKREVPASKKIVSLFEPETDIISKGKRDTVFGHKLLLASGKSSLILQLTTLDGNPADSTLVEKLLDNHKSVYQVAPEQMALGGCFGSAKN